MKSVIYYFTGTGNNLQVAKRLAKALPDCKLVSMGKGRHDSVLVQKITTKTQQPVGKVNEPLNVLTAIGQKLIYARKDKGFKVSDSCTGCGTCEAVCPVANIVMEREKPSFLHNCEQCMACVQWCPKQAINYKNKTQSRGRYTNPSISLREVIEGNKSI